MKSAPYYIIVNSVDFETKATDWNTGVLIMGPNDRTFVLDFISKSSKCNSHTLIPKGTNNIWRKKPHQIKSYYNNSYLTALNRRNMLRDAGWNHNENGTLISLVDLSILELVDSEPLSNPFKAVLDAESEIIRQPEQIQQLSPTGIAAFDTIDLNLEPDSTQTQLPQVAQMFADSYVSVSAHVSTTGSTFQPVEDQEPTLAGSSSTATLENPRKRKIKQWFVITLFLKNLF